MQTPDAIGTRNAECGLEVCREMMLAVDGSQWIQLGATLRQLQD